MNYIRSLVRHAAIVLNAALFLAILSSCTSGKQYSGELSSHTPTATGVVQTESQSEPTPSSLPVVPTINPALIDPFTPPEDLSLCDEINLRDGTEAENKIWISDHTDQWVKIAGLELDWDKSGDALYVYYAPHEPGGDSFQVNGDMNFLIVLSDGLSDTAYMFLANVGGSIAGNNAFIENAESIVSDPTGPNGEAPGSDGFAPFLSFTADDITSNQPRFLSNYEGQYVTVSEINVYGIYEDHIGGSVNVYFSNQDDLFAVNEGNVITVSGYVSQDNLWDDVIITDAVLVSVDKESMWG